MKIVIKQMEISTEGVPQIDVKRIVLLFAINGRDAGRLELEEKEVKDFLSMIRPSGKERRRDCVVMVDPDGKLIHASGYWQEIIGE